MREIKSTNIRADLIKEIQKNLWENLNSPKFKRMQASQQASAADMHFYQKVFPNSVLKELASTGSEFSLWGDVVKLKKKKTDDQKLYIGCTPDDGFAPVGLRWCRDAADWVQSNKQTRQIDKRGNVQVWRPQIIVTMRPLHLFDKWYNDDKTTSANDATGKARKFIEKVVKAQPEWKDVKIIPLHVTLRIKGHSQSYPTSALRYSNGIETTEESRHHYDDEIFKDDPDYTKKMDEETGHINDMIKFLRQLDARYNEEVGVSW